MIDHTGFVVSDFSRSLAFYTQALAPLGYLSLMEFSAEANAGSRRAGFGVPPTADFWIYQGSPNVPRMHVAFSAPNRAAVQAFHAAAIAAGGQDNGPPGLRPHYHPGYYAAFVLDPDGHNIEAVCRMGQL